MCWLGNIKDHIKKHIAQEDIKTYKILKQARQSYVSPFYGMDYKIGEENKSIINISDTVTLPGYFRIEEGLHSYDINNTPIIGPLGFVRIYVYGYALGNYNAYDLSEFYGECIIPKGSIYYFNGLEYVSNKLILKSVKPLSNILLQI